MSITIFGVVCLTALAVAFVNNNANLMLTLLILGMNLQSASVFILNGQGVGLQIIVSAVFIAWAFVYSSIVSDGKLIIERSAQSRKTSTIATILLGMISAIVIYKLGTYKQNNTIVLYLIQFLVYAICYLSVWCVHKRFRYEDVDRIIIWVITIIAAIGIIQILTTINILPRNFILETFIYTKDTPSAYYLAQYYPRIFSVFMEPSYCAAFLVGGFYYLIAKEKINKYGAGLSILLVVEILLTFSSTAYGAFFVTGLVYLVISKNKKALKWLIPLAIMMGMVLLATGALQEMLNNVIFDKSKTASAITRGGWDKKAMAAFQENPWFGVGYKGVRGSHLYTSLLGQMGIVGTTLYILMIAPLLIAAFKNRQTNSAALFLVGSITSQLIALPDLDFCVFWEGMYIIALFLGMQKGESAYGSVNCDSNI